MGKNLLSDTDYTKGWDNRFGVSVVIGKVSKIEVSDKGANVRVIMPDRVDRNGTPLITKPIPVLQIAGTAKKSFAVPRLNDNVLLVKMPNGTSNYMVVGSFYTSKAPPPVTDPKLDYVVYDDGSTMQFDPSTGTLTWVLKGGIEITTDKDVNVTTKGKVTVNADGDVTVKTKGAATVDATGDVLVKAGGNATLQGAAVNLTGPMNFNGNITHNGSMVTTGHHTDAAGHHTQSARESELLARIEALEGRVAAALEAARP